MYKTAEIVVVGSEFFSRDKRDTNSIWLTEELEKRGVQVTSKVIVADDLERLTSVIRHGLKEVDLVISTGGLGPTEDDRTREAAACAFGVELVHVQEIEDEIRRRFERRGRTMAENNRSQAFVPQGGKVVSNATGTAPGFVVHGDGGEFLALPGPPREMYPMFFDFLEQNADRLPSDSQLKIRRTLRVTGLGESDMDRKIADLYKDLTNPEVTINFTPHDLEIHLTARAQSEEEGEALIAPIVSAMENRLEGFLFSVQDESLAEVVVKLARASGIRLSLTESVTGGHAAHKICSVPGASEVFWGGLTAYTEEAKQELLGVKESTLEEHSAVSEEVALEMVEGLYGRSGTELCMSCTGYAGPGGGTEKNPVGTAYIGFKTPEQVSVRRISLPGSRNLMRSRTTQAMLFMLFKYLRKTKVACQGASATSAPGP